MPMLSVSPSRAQQIALDVERVGRIVGVIEGPAIVQRFLEIAAFELLPGDHLILVAPNRVGRAPARHPFQRVVDAQDCACASRIITPSALCCKIAASRRRSWSMRSYNCALWTRNRRLIGEAFQHLHIVRASLSPHKRER